MKHLLCAIAALGVFTASAQAAPERYTLDPTHTNIVWKANHFGFSNPSGRFADVTGTLELDEADLAKSKVEVKVKTNSIHTGIPKFDDHLKSKDFFSAAEFADATFTSTKVEAVAKDKAKVTGNLTLHGVTKPVVLEMQINKIAANPMSKKKTAGFSGKAVIKRSEFGISYALPGVSDEVTLDLEVEAILADK